MCIYLYIYIYIYERERETVVTFSTPMLQVQAALPSLPSLPVVTFPMSELDAALAHMATGKHIGKILVSTSAVLAHRQMPAVAGPPHDPLLRSLLALCPPFKVLYVYRCVYIYVYVYMYVYAHRQMPTVAGPPHDPLLRSLLALCPPFKVHA